MIYIMCVWQRKYFFQFLQKLKILKKYVLGTYIQDIFNNMSNVFRSHYNLKRHQNNIHTDELDASSKVLLEKDDMNTPEKTPKPFKCSDCDRSFTKRFNLKRHEATHLSLQLYECPSCSKCFSLESKLKIHQQTHYSI